MSTTLWPILVSLETSPFAAEICPSFHVTSPYALHKEKAPSPIVGPGVELCDTLADSTWNGKKNSAFVRSINLTPCHPKKKVRKMHPYL